MTDEVGGLGALKPGQDYTIQHYDVDASLEAQILREVQKRYEYWAATRQGWQHAPEPCVTVAILMDELGPREAAYRFVPAHEAKKARNRTRAMVRRAADRLVDQGLLERSIAPSQFTGREVKCYAPGQGAPTQGLGAITRPDLKLLSDAWDAAPDATDDPRVQAMINSEIARINAAFEQLPIQVKFVDFDPYASFEQMRDQVASTGTMLIYKGGSETPLWDKVTNWKARAVHDWDHITKACDFSMEGEHAAFREAAQCRPQLAPVYMSEIVLQAAIANYRGGFVEQKLVILPEELQRRAEKLRGGLGQLEAESDEWTEAVWTAAGMLDMGTPLPLVVIHLASMGFDKDESLIIADAATRLREAV